MIMNITGYLFVLEEGRSKASKCDTQREGKTGNPSGQKQGSSHSVIEDPENEEEAVYGLQRGK